MNTIFHHHQALRAISAGVVAIFVVLNGRWHLIGEAVVSPAFYFALLVSFGIAFFLLYLVQVGNSFLDGRIAWSSNFFLRLFFQFFMCLVLPSVIDVALVSLYFKATDSIFDVTDYLFHDYPIIGLLLVLLNFYYTVPHFLGQPKAAHPQQDSLQHHLSETTMTHPHILKLSHAGKSVHFDVATDLLYFCRISKRVWVFTKDGDKYHIDDSLSNLQERYHDAGMVQINRSTIINIAVVKGYAKGLRRYTLDLIVKDEYKAVPTMDNSGFLVVTKEYIPVFKAQMELNYPHAEDME